MTRWTKTSDRTDRIIDPFPGMDEKTSCSVLSRKGTGVEYGTGCLTKEARFFYPYLRLWPSLFFIIEIIQGRILIKEIKLLVVVEVANPSLLS